MHLAGRKFARGFSHCSSSPSFLCLPSKCTGMARPPDSIHEDCGFLTFVFPPGGDVSLRRATELGSMALAFIGGGLIVTSGFTVHGFLLSLLSLVSGGLPTVLPGAIAIPLSITVSFLSALVALGVVTVLLVGIALYRRRVFVRS